MWFVLDNALVLPEYLVEFEYISGANQSLGKPGSTTDPLKKPLDSVDLLNDDCNKLLAAVNSAQRVLENTYIRHAQREASRLQALSLTSLDLDRSDMGCLKKTIVSFMRSCHIEELLNNNYQFLDDEITNSAQLAIENSMPPEIPIRSKIDEITEGLIVNVCREMELSQIVYLNLFSNRIKKIKCLEKMVNLQTLILSFNEIEQIEGLPAEGKGLRRLDLNHNFIRRIEGLEGKGSLQNLNLTNNWISDINQIEHLRIHCPQIRELSLKCNPIAAKKSYRATVF
jgi:Leucine-rich repeat (LRR) protein